MGEAEETGSPVEDPFPPDPTEEQRPRISARDPVCGVDVDPAGAAGSTEYRGVPYYFCTLLCKATFEVDPARYVGK